MFPISRFRVLGHSMEPTYTEGDYVVVVSFLTPKKGDVVVFSKNGKKMIKRVTRIGSNNYHFKSDNHGTSGTVKKEDIIGKVVLRIKN
jgi:phage repressor protein C with HTH and peptisase S24 domain